MTFTIVKVGPYRVGGLVVPGASPGFSALPQIS